MRTWIDFTDPYEKWSKLGHDYRVIVHVNIWQAENVLMAPTGSLFRKGNEWAIFTVRDGRARSIIVKTGHSNNRMVEILSGLSEGDSLVLHPSDRVYDGAAVKEREMR